MPLAVSPNARASNSAPDDIDALFNYDDDVNDFLKDIPIEKNANAPQEPTKNIDEEITVKKKRQPVRKLDDALLQSDKGLPKLRKITKSRLRFRGKGHEFSDMAMLLSTYQLWLDDMYPRAKFRDALAMVEKLGHSKRMQVMRRAWLDETKPSARDASPEIGGDVAISGALPAEGCIAEIGTHSDRDEDMVSQDIRPEEHHKEQQKDAGTNQEYEDAPDEDELDALLGEDMSAPKKQQTTSQRKGGPFEEDEDDDDELDALLAEQPTSRTAVSQQSRDTASNSTSNLAADFADDEEAMADMDMW